MFQAKNIEYSKHSNIRSKNAQILKKYAAKMHFEVYEIFPRNMFLFEKNYLYMFMKTDEQSISLLQGHGTDYDDIF